MNTRREDRTHVLKTHSRTHDRSAQFFSAQTRTFAPPSPGKTAQIQFERPEELVWRQTTTLTSENRSRSTVNAVTQRELNRTVVEERPVQTTSSSTSQPAPQPITKLDPTLIDRLTDNVIRRVEQRARIERQRRGL